MNKLLNVSIIVFILVSGCEYRKKEQLHTNVYCLESLEGEKCFEKYYNPVINFNDDKFWKSFFETFLKKKQGSQNFSFIDEKNFNGILQKKYVSVGTDYYVYLNEEIGPIVVISSDLIINNGVVCYLKEQTKYNSKQIDSLQNLCIEIFNKSGGLQKEKT